MIGLDVGGTKIAAVLLDDEDAVVTRSWGEHAARGIDALADELAVRASALLEETDASPTGLGVSVSGLVARDGRVTSGASLEIVGDLAGAVRDRLSLPTTVVNDGEATLRSVLAAHRARTGDDITDAVLLTLGTGVGGAIVSAGRPLRGRTGLATELGHLPVRAPSAQRCVCGSSGCLEQFAGGRGMAERAQLLVREGRASSALVDLAQASPAALTSRDVVEAARTGDPSALQLVDEAAAAVADAIRSLCVTIEPDIVFLGGTIAHAAADLLPDRIRAHIAQRWSFADLTTPPPVQLDTIGPYAAAVGAALLAKSPDHDSDILIAPEGTTHHD